MQSNRSVSAQDKSSSNKVEFKGSSEKILLTLFPNTEYLSFPGDIMQKHKRLFNQLVKDESKCNAVNKSELLVDYQKAIQSSQNKIDEATYAPEFTQGIDHSSILTYAQGAESEKLDAIAEPLKKCFGLKNN